MVEITHPLYRFVETLLDPKVWVMALFAAIMYVYRQLQSIPEIHHVHMTETSSIP
jgi:hypothetical protein